MSRAAESESGSESESAGVGSFDRSRSRLQHFFIISFLVEMETKMETEHFVLTADSRHDGLPCTALLSLGLRLFPDELAFNHTSRPDHHNRQRHSAIRFEVQLLDLLSTAADCVLKWGAIVLSKRWCQNHSGRCEAPPRMFG